MTDTQDLIQRIAEAKEHALLYGGLTTAFWPYQRFAITVGELFDALETAQAEIERLRNEKSGPYFGHYQDALGKIARLEGHIKHIGNDALRTENAELRARLAELAKQKPCASMPRCALNGAEDCTCGVNGPCEGLTDVYLAAGASPEPSALQAENANLITALAACRDAFPAPAKGSELDGWYVGAIADPLAVPEYVKAESERLESNAKADAYAYHHVCVERSQRGAALDTALAKVEALQAENSMLRQQKEVMRVEIKELESKTDCTDCTDEVMNGLMLEKAHTAMKDQRDAALARLAEVQRANHEWHLNHDEYDGYQESELWGINTASAGASPVEPSQEQFCYCNDSISLQSVSGGGSAEGLYGSVRLKVGGEFVRYVKQPSQAGELLDHEQKAEIVSNWFSDEDMQSRAMQMLGDIEQAIAAINAKEQSNG